MADDVGGKTSKVKVKLFEGTAAEQTVECGQSKVLADAHFIGQVHTPFGPDDAKAIRAKIAGEPVPPSFREVVASPTTKRRIAQLQAEKTRKSKEKATGFIESDEGEPLGVAVQKSKLQAQLDAFEGDPEMQALVFSRWQDQQAKERAAATAPADEVAA